MSSNSRKRAASPNGSPAPRKRIKEVSTTANSESTATKPTHSNKRSAKYDLEEAPRKKLRPDSTLHHDSSLGLSPADPAAENFSANPDSSLDPQMDDDFDQHKTRSKVQANIHDLSVEVFQQVIKYVVDEDDMKNTLKACLVSRVFDKEVFAEIFWTGAIDKHFHHAPPRWLFKRLTDMTLSKRHSRSNVFFETIREACRTVSATFEDHPFLIIPCLSELALDYMGREGLKKAAFDEDSEWALALSDVHKACICLAIHESNLGGYRFFLQTNPALASDRRASKYFGSPAWVAAWFGNTTMIRQLRDDGFSFNTFEAGNNKTPLTVACSKQGRAYEESAILILKALLEENLTIVEDWQTVVDFAHRERSFEMFQLLTEPKVRAATMPFIERTFVIECDGDGPLDLVKHMLLCGVDPDVQLLFDYRHRHIGVLDITPLQNAVVSGEIELVSLLLEHGADPNRTAPWNVADTSLPICLAIMTNQSAMVELLLQFGAAKYGRDKTSYKPFNILMMKDTWSLIPIFKVALAHFDMSNQQDDEHAYEALIEASYRNRPDLIRILAAAGCSIHGRWEPPLEQTYREAERSVDEKLDHHQQDDDDDDDDEGEEEGLLSPILTPLTMSRPHPPWTEEEVKELQREGQKLPPRHVMRMRPAIAFAQWMKNREAEAVLWELGAVYNYPYDVLLRRPGESAYVVDGRAGPFRDVIRVRDDMLEVEIEEGRLRDVPLADGSAMKGGRREDGIQIASRVAYELAKRVYEPWICGEAAIYG